MFRRSLISTLAAVSTLPFISNRDGPSYPPPIPSEGNLMFWFHFYSAIDRERAMSTGRARQQTIEELDLTTLRDDEAVQLLKLANEGVYEKEDMPDRWQNVFDLIERKF